MTCSLPVAGNDSFQLLHLWAVDQEKYALSALSEPTKAAGVKWSEQIISRNGITGVREVFADQVALNNPPGGVFWLGGAAIYDLVRNDTLRVIPDKNNHRVFSEDLLPEVYKAIKHENGITSLPIGIHIQNIAIYNTQILDELNLSIPTSWAEFLENAPIIKAAGYAPLSMSDQAWLIRFLVTSIMFEQIEKDDFVSVLYPDAEIEKWRSILKKTLETLQKLRPYVNSNYHNLNWSRMVENVTTGKAASLILSDFSSPIFRELDHIQCALPPGNKTLLWSFDTIALSNIANESKIRGQDVFINVASKSENIDTYIARKGGIPVYKNYEGSKLDTCSQLSLKLWNQMDSKLHLHPTYIFKHLYVMSIGFQQFWIDPNKDIDKALNNIINLLKSQ